MIAIAERLFAIYRIFAIDSPHKIGYSSAASQDVLVVLIFEKKQSLVSNQHSAKNTVETKSRNGLHRPVTDRLN